MYRVTVHIDGFNLYHAIEALGKPTLKWLDMRRLCEQQLRDGESLVGVNFYTAIWPYDQMKQQRHKNYIRALQATGVLVHEGNFKRSMRLCHKHDRSCPFREEKQTDVSVALGLARDAFEQRAERIILVTADSDQIPTVKLLHEIGGPKLTLLYPPGRATVARELGKYVTDRKELSVGQLMTCPLPRTVMDSEGRAVAHMPAHYLV
jgi:uncharacterized LabA/DUF88 family protein